MRLRSHPTIIYYLYILYYLIGWEQYFISLSYNIILYLNYYIFIKEMLLGCYLYFFIIFYYIYYYSILINSIS